MADPLSITGTAVGVVSLGIQVTQSLVEFYNSYKHQDSELRSITERLEDLTETFRSLERSISNRTFQVEERNSIETSIANCKEHIQELQEECQKFCKPSSTGIRAAVKVAGRRVTYPFRRSTLQKVDEDIGEIRANLSLALDVLHLEDSQRLQDDINDMKAQLELVNSRQISSDLHEWLQAPDILVDYNAACAKKHPGTGTWLIKSSAFSEWLRQENSMIWLRGFAGSGKSVLCSTAIQSGLRRRGYEPNIGIAYFFFTFNNDSKQDDSSMIRALLLQLSHQLQDDHTDIRQLHKLNKAGIPAPAILLEYLRRLIRRFHHVYVFLDALDESPRNGPREHVLDTLEKIQQWNLQNLHLFVTSRDEPDIRESFNAFTVETIEMRNTGIDEDIANFISSQLNQDRMLQKLSPYHEKIRTALAEGAKGL